MAYLKRYAMPAMWPVARKTKTWVTAPLPGPHPKKNCIPLQIILRDVLHVAATAQEARTAIHQGKVLVDKKPRTEPAYPAGLMDVIEIPDLQKHYRIGLNKKGLVLEEVTPEKSSHKLCHIIRKTTVRSGKIQLTLHDGRTMLVDDAAVYAVGDSLLLDLPEQKIQKHYKMEKGVPALIVAGRHIGRHGTIKDIQRRRTMVEKSMVTLTVDKKDVQTPLDYVMPGEV